MTFWRLVPYGNETKKGDLGELLCTLLTQKEFYPLRMG